MNAAWIAIACANHVARGRAGGYIQVCHGKGGPLARVKPGDRVAYYSPTTEMGGGAACRAFTALGVVAPGALYRFDMGGGFVPFRRDVKWFDAKPAEIRPLLDALELTRGTKNWGAKFRFGLVKISAADMDRIAEAMGVQGSVTFGRAKRDPEVS